MKLYLVGEGPHDIGVRNYWCDRTSQHIDLDGWLQPIIKQIRAEDELDILSLARDRLLIDQKLAKRLRPLPRGHGVKALLAKRAALVAECNIVIYMVDADSTNIRKWREIVAEIEAGFDALHGPIVSVACVPMSASESWLLSDTRAWNHTTGYSGALPNWPETIWGNRDDPQGNHPHQHFRRICDQAGCADNRDIRAQLGGQADLATLRAKCAQSFTPFENSLLAA